MVIGTQWGDEGKGKVTDYLAERSDMVVRYQGGSNAGHTVWIAGQRFALHLVPTGIFYRETRCVMGNGMVIDPVAFAEELDYLHARGVSTENLYLSDRAHLVFPYHQALDEVAEQGLGTDKIGTTLRGIGPAYMDKAARTGIRVADLFEPRRFANLLHRNVEEKNRLLRELYHREGFDEAAIRTQYLDLAERMRPFVTDTSVLVNEALDAGETVLFEGAQGTMLDIDHGTYPYVTASNPVAGGVCIGAGVGPTRIETVIGVVKAYTTRVGDGPFPTELNDPIGDQIREVGHEYGTTTGRPRRVGWLDTVVVRHAARVSGVSALAITLLDVLSGLDEVRVCTAYELDGKRVEHLPASLEQLQQCQPVYETLPGWKEPLDEIRDYRELPQEAKQYLQTIERTCGIPVAILSAGPDRTQTFQLREVPGFGKSHR